MRITIYDVNEDELPEIEEILQEQGLWYETEFDG